MTVMNLVNNSDRPCWSLAHSKGDTKPGKPVDLISPIMPSLERTQHSVTENSYEEDGKETAPSLFLDLPTEIRLEIFRHLLVLPADAPPPSQNTYYQLGQHRPLLYPAILCTNRQLHAEALPLLYRKNTFLAHNTLLTTLPRLRRIYDPVLSARLAGLITRFYVRVRLDAEPGYDREQAAEQLSNKEEVVLDAWQAGVLPLHLKTVSRY
ncbi:hypothetical protein F4774DRAFT_116508 [Daldinia eschscholtzii]|nr:hypothetical protein F4774DRAFT_116508 [Daldinia eschscholtzii]